MIAVSRFFPRLLPMVIGCPEPLAHQAVVDAAITFCERSLVLTEMLPESAVMAGDDNVLLDLPNNVAVAQVLRAWYDGDLLSPVPLHSANFLTGMPGHPRYFYGESFEADFTIRLYPTPVVPGVLRIRAALKPTRDAIYLHEQLYDDWMDAIVDGAAARIKATPEQQYTDFTLAGVLMAKARAAANAARSDGLYGKAQSQLTVTMRPFA